MDGIAWAASAMVAARQRLDIATGNLANVSTNGFTRLVAHGALTRSGVEIRAETSHDAGPLRHTGRRYDIALIGDGSFRVRDHDGAIVSTRDGSFEPDRFGHLVDGAGRVLQGVRGSLRVPAGSTIDARGRVLKEGRIVDRLALQTGTTLRSGFIETANVDAIGEMVSVLTAQRSFESAEKIVAAIDGTRQKSANDVARVK